jgi:hypothetical protein
MLFPFTDKNDGSYANIITEKETKFKLYVRKRLDQWKHPFFLALATAKLKNPRKPYHTKPQGERPHGETE